MNNVGFGKTMENVRKYRDSKFETTNRRRNYLLSEPNYHTTKWFSENLLAIEMKKIEVKMNKPVYLYLSILEISKTLIYDFWHDYIKPKYQYNAKLCYLDTDTFIMHIEAKGNYEDIADDVEKRFDTLNYGFNRPLSKGKIKKAIGLMKDELDRKIMTESAGFRTKTCSYLIDDGSEDEKTEGTKKRVINKTHKFIDYKKMLEKQ